MLAIRTNSRIKRGEQIRDLARELIFWKELEKAWIPFADKYPTLGEFLKSRELKLANGRWEARKTKVGAQRLKEGSRIMNP
jgi:hypothetical protein